MESIEDREETPETPVRELAAYGALGGRRVPCDVVVDMDSGRTKSRRISISGPR